MVTNKLLDCLKENEVKATFFVVGKEIKEKENILKRIHEEGHSIGLHTYSHNFKRIYKDNEYFIQEMKKTSFMIKNIIGIEPKVIRFPGGSSGVLTEELLEKLHTNGFKVYDWNVDLRDGVNPSLSVENLIKNSKKAKGDQSNRIILAHCNYNNMNTCRALSGIIKYYKENGFTFETIDENTEEYYYKLKK
jgi:peptidoglycan/xylan/chitin deacetylase (PgdA/CDA1 family)